MREIKFRGKRLDNGELVYGFVWLSLESRAYIMLDGTGKGDWVHYGVEPETVGQYTGLKDKNGKEIYEGDVCTCGVFHGASKKSVPTNMVVRFGGHCQFYLQEDIENRIFNMPLYSDNIEVISNIYEKPELLNQLENK